MSQETSNWSKLLQEISSVAGESGLVTRSECHSVFSKWGFEEADLNALIVNKQLKNLPGSNEVFQLSESWLRQVQTVKSTR